MVNGVIYLIKNIIVVIGFVIIFVFIDVDGIYN